MGLRACGVWFASHLSITSQHLGQKKGDIYQQFQYYFVSMGLLHTFTLCDHRKQMSLWTHSSTSSHLKCEADHIILLVKLSNDFPLNQNKNLNSYRGLQGPAWSKLPNFISCHSPHSPCFICTILLSLHCSQALKALLIDTHVAGSLSFGFQLKCHLLEKSSLTIGHTAVCPCNSPSFSITLSYFLHRSHYYLILHCLFICLLYIYIYPF